MQFLELCRERKISIEKLRFFSERAYGKVVLGPNAIYEFATSPMLSLSKMKYAVRRSLDVVLACFALILTLPVTLLTMFAIKLDSSGTRDICPGADRRERTPIYHVQVSFDVLRR